MTAHVQTTRQDHVIAWLAALAVAIHVLEAALPSPLPGVKPGLANVITVAVLCAYGWTSAAWVALLRVLVGGLLVGTFLSPTFVLSMSGAVGSLIALGVVWAAARRVPAWAPGPVGYSVLAAMAHMASQFAIAYLLFIPHDALFNLLPVLMTLSVVFGMISGLIAQGMLKQISEL